MHKPQTKVFNRSTRQWLIILFIFSMFIRLGFCWYRTDLGHSFEIDYREYIMQGARLLSTGMITSPLIIDDALAIEPSAVLPPFYTIIVAGVYGLFGTESFSATLTLQMINALITSLAAIVIFVVGFQLANIRTAWISAIFVAINPTIFGYTHLIWDTSLFTFLVSLTVLFSIYLSYKKEIFYWLLFGAWLGLVAMLNPSLTLCYPLLVLWSLIRMENRSKKMIVRGVTLAVLGWLIAITPWTMRNYHHFDRMIYIRSALMQELWLGVCPEAENDGSAVFTNQFALKNSDVRNTIITIGEQAYIDECGDKAIESIKTEPLRFFKLIGIRTIDYWLGTVYSHTIKGAGGWPRSLSRMAVTVFLITELMILVACLLMRRISRPDLKWLISMVILFSVVYCITHVQIRFRAPAEPIMAVILGILISDVWQRIARQRTTP